MARGRKPSNPAISDDHRAKARADWRRRALARPAKEPRLWKLGNETEAEFLARIQAQKESVRQALNY